jgi:hypothetical protein
MNTTKWKPYETKEGTVEIKVEYPTDGALPNKLYIRRTKDKYVTIDSDTMMRKYNSADEAIEAESRILF